MVTGLVRPARLAAENRLRCAVTGRQDPPRHMWKASDCGKGTESVPSINVSRLSYVPQPNIKFRNIEHKANRRSASEALATPSLCGIRNFDKQGHERCSTCAHPQVSATIYSIESGEEGATRATVWSAIRSIRISKGCPKISERRREQVPRLSTLPAPDDNTKNHLFFHRSSQKIHLLGSEVIARM